MHGRPLEVRRPLFRGTARRVLRTPPLVVQPIARGVPIPFRPPLTLRCPSAPPPLPLGQTKLVVIGICVAICIAVLVPVGMRLAAYSAPYVPTSIYYSPPPPPPVTP